MIYEKFAIELMINLNQDSFDLFHSTLRLNSR